MTRMPGETEAPSRRSRRGLLQNENNVSRHGNRLENNDDGAHAAHPMEAVNGMVRRVV